MLFWLLVIILVIGVVGIIVGNLLYDHTRYDTEWLIFTGWVIAIIAAIAVLISGIIMIAEYTTADMYVAKNQEKYKSLTYQVENDVFDNDNDVGKKELYDQVREWNEDLAYYREIQDDFWLGIYYPNVFDQFEFIEYKGG